MISSITTGFVHFKSSDSNYYIKNCKISGYADTNVSAKLSQITNNDNVIMINNNFDNFLATTYSYNNSRVWITSGNSGNFEGLKYPRFLMDDNSFINYEFDPEISSYTTLCRKIYILSNIIK
jgi:hypothetical protein